jgi:hypothetical protein
MNGLLLRSTLESEHPAGSFLLSSTKGHHELAAHAFRERNETRALIAAKVICDNSRRELTTNVLTRLESCAISGKYRPAVIAAFYHVVTCPLIFQSQRPGHNAEASVLGVVSRVRT